MCWRRLYVPSAVGLISALLARPRPYGAGVVAAEGRRRWANHVPISGLVNGFAMTEQLRSTSRACTGTRLGQVSAETMDEARIWLSDFLDLPAR